MHSLHNIYTEDTDTRYIFLVIKIIYSLEALLAKQCTLCILFFFWSLVQCVPCIRQSRLDLKKTPDPRQYVNTHQVVNIPKAFCLNLLHVYFDGMEMNMIYCYSLLFCH